MAHLTSILKLSCAMLFALQAAGAEGSVPTNTVTNAAPSTGTTLESFRIISERNIFNQNRASRAARRATTERRVQPVVHALSLVGTMSYEKGNFAFFNGTRPEYRKPAKAGEKIAGYEVKEITPTTVTIANETQEFEMKVGQQLRREGEGEWQLSTTSTRLTSSESSTEPGEATTAESGISAGGTSEDEALKRLMEKRAKEINE